MTDILAWHFLRDSGKLLDGRDAPKDGVLLKHEGRLELCDSGLHASRNALDALRYAPGAIVCRVTCGGTIVEGGDKLVCSERTILWRADATETLRSFARWCALSAIDLWDVPDVVRRYFETGDESLRGAAESAAWSAAWSAVRSAAWSAARSRQSEKLAEMLLALEPKR